MAQSLADRIKAQDIVEKKSAASMNRSGLDAKFEKFYKMYNAKLDNKEGYTYRSKLYMKETFKVIDTLHPIFMDMLYMKGNPFKVKGTKEKLTDKQAKMYERLMSIYFNRMNSYCALDDFVTELLITGTAFAKVYWEKKVRMIAKDEEVEESSEVADWLDPESVTKTKIIKTNVEHIVTDTPRFEHVSYKDIFVSSRAKTLENTWLIHRTWKSLEQLKKEDSEQKKKIGKKRYKNLGDLKPAGIEGRLGDIQEQITIKEKQEIGIQLSADKDAQNIDTYEDIELVINSEGDLEILEYWSTDGSEMKVVAGGRVLIKEEKNPFEHGDKPFVYSNYKKRPGEIFGIGICELAEDGQDLVNTAVNQAMDSNNLVNNLMFVVSREAGVDTDQLKARPGGFIFVDNPEQVPLNTIVEQIKFSKVDTSSEIALGIRDINESSGAGRIMQGTYESGAVRNTSQTRLLMSSGGRKLAGKVLTFEEMFLKPLVNIVYKLIQQFMTREMVVDVIGKDGEEYIEVTPDKVAMDLDFIPIGTKQLIEMEQLVHQMNNFMAIASKIPMAEAVVKFRVLLRKIWANMSTDTDNEDILYTEEESMKIIQQMVQAQTQQAGGNTQPNTGGQNPSQPNPAGGSQV